MKIKVIDLLVKIANGEEVPKKIKYNNKIWEYYVCANDYKGEDIWLFEELFEYRRTIEFINDEVEIIEEDKKIEKLDIKQEKNIKNNWKWKCNGYNISTPQKIMADKLNELIDEINNLKEK